MDDGLAEDEATVARITAAVLASATDSDVRRRVAALVAADEACTAANVAARVPALLDASGLGLRLRHQIRTSAAQLRAAPQPAAGAAAEATTPSPPSTIAASAASSSASSSSSSAPHQPVRPPRLPQPQEPLTYVDQARRQWDQRLRYEVRAVASKRGRKLVQVRLSDKTDDDYAIRFVYTSEDLLDTISQIQSPNAAAPANAKLDGHMVHVQLRTPRWSELCDRYADCLGPGVRQIGVDDRSTATQHRSDDRNASGAAFAQQQRLEAERLLRQLQQQQQQQHQQRQQQQQQQGGQQGDATPGLAALRRHARTGVEASVRPRVWNALLGVSVGPSEFAYFERMLTLVQHWELITDDLTRFDVQDTADHDAFFMFEEQLDEMLLVLSRDAWVASHCAINVNTAVLRVQPAAGVDLSRLPGPPIEAVPPSNIIPFYRLCMYAAPMCYLFAKAEQVYFTFRAMYCRYFCRLHVVSSRPDTILYLARTFEDLSIAAEPRAFFHCVQTGCHPLTFAFPWLFSAFASYLAVDQVLLLWDRLLACDSLELLAVLAAAVFRFRARSVIKAESVAEIQDLFREVSSLQVVPLLQSALFPSAGSDDSTASH